MKNDTIFQDKLDDLKLQMAMQLLGQKELEESEKEIENLNSLPEVYKEDVRTDRLSCRWSVCYGKKEY